jgi:hypothetical protein
MAPVPSTLVSGYYVIPSYTAPGYDALTHGSSGSGGYFKIGPAYGYGCGAGNYDTANYVSSICGSNEYASVPPYVSSHSCNM